ncbi:hypothetical protein [Desulfuromonas sp. AOP6]|uniref:hypothetical protein n=1 Tax=Desulfuromonas sp. AOP6 TaxID=1566351 RepID=UPI0012801F0C|nr:hypothetical protein [Desulfuromonas sp. AOP6]BCA78565.1 hypothetical protein AOP6_0352 [Desulfuromonas sp. AOP6]
MVEPLIPLLLFLILLFLCIKGFMWGASLMVLLQNAISCLVISLVIIFALPTEGDVIGPNLPYIPISISAVILVSAVLSIVIAQKNKNVASGKHNAVGIAVLSLGIVLWAVGFVSFCLFIFGGLEGGPDPKAAVISFSVLNIAGAIAIYFSTKYESVKFPNVYRWFSFWASNFMFFAIFICSMIFLFAFPATSPETHSFWASVNSINYVPVALLFIAINQSYVKKKRANPSLHTVG